jgi:oryzin
MLFGRDLLSGIGATYDMDHLKGYQITADVAAIAEIAASPLVGYLIPPFFQYQHYHV